MIKGRDLLIYFAIKYKGSSRKILDAIQSKECPSLDEVEKAVQSVKSKVVTVLDEEYPKVLFQINATAFVLFYDGDISVISDYTRCVSVVGSRTLLPYEVKNLNTIMDQLGDKVTIISGLAIGADSLAQRRALQNGAKVVAVLGNGIDICYPLENYDLYEMIKEKGLIISEYPGKTETFPENFLIRNRRNII